MDLSESGLLDSVLGVNGFALECYVVRHAESNWSWAHLVANRDRRGEGRCRRAVVVAVARSRRAEVGIVVVGARGAVLEVIAGNRGELREVGGDRRAELHEEELRKLRVLETKRLRA